MDRRNFIKTGAFAASTLLMPYASWGATEKIKLAILGTGCWGTDLLLQNAVASGQFEIVALCDVNSVSLNRAADVAVSLGEKKPQLFSDYKQMFALRELQAVAIATPTHWHALQFIDACKRGLHVFLEKPICYDIREGQAMLEAHRKAKNVVQVDFPRVMVDTNDQVRAFIQGGGAGKILEVKANINNPEGALVEKQIPGTINFDAFCGPAPRNKFLCDENGDNPNWRGQHDFSRGIMADWGIHYLHNVRRVMGLDVPDSVTAIGGTVKLVTQQNPDYLDVRFNFGSLPVYWSHKTWGYTSPTPDNDIGVYYYGEKATVFAGDLGWEVYPAGGGAKIPHGDVRFNPGEPETAKIYTGMMTGLFKQFADKAREKNNDGMANSLEDAFKTTSSVIYGDMAFLTKSSITIDKATMNVKDNAAAQRLLKRDYRAPYKHPHSGA